MVCISHRRTEGRTSARRAVDTMITSSESGSGVREWSVLSVWAIEELAAWLRGSVDQSTRARAAIHRRPMMPNDLWKFGASPSGCPFRSVCAINLDSGHTAEGAELTTPSKTGKAVWVNPAVTRAGALNWTGDNNLSYATNGAYMLFIFIYYIKRQYTSWRSVTSPHSAWPDSHSSTRSNPHRQNIQLPSRSGLRRRHNPLGNHPDSSLCVHQQRR